MKLRKYHIPSDIICGNYISYIIVIEIKMCFVNKDERILSISLYIIVTPHLKIKSLTSMKYKRDVG